jgi:hypothetical protein
LAHVELQAQTHPNRPRPERLDQKFCIHMKARVRECSCEFIGSWGGGAGSCGRVWKLAARAGLGDELEGVLISSSAADESVVKGIPGLTTGSLRSA